MEIALQKEMMQVSETVCRKLSEAVAEGDIIVPDTKPDMEAVLNVSGKARITGREILGDKVRINGMAEYTVLYCAEKESGEVVESLHFSLPFKDICALGQSGEGLSLTADAEIASTETMLLNSRKLSVKGTVHLQMEAVRDGEAALIVDAESEVPLSVRRRPLKISETASRGSFTVTAADTLSIPEGKPSAESILHTEARIIEEDIKLITGKMLIKGTVCLRTLYKSTLPARPIECMEHEMPFTEILDLPGTEEGMTYFTEYEITDIYTETDDEDGRSFGAEVTAEIRAKVVNTRELSILDDCFCPGHKTEVSYGRIRTETVRDTVSEELSHKKSIALPAEYPPIREVSYLTAMPAVTTVSLADGEIAVEGYADAQLLYLTEESEPIAWKERIPFAFTTKTVAPSDAEIACRVRQMGVSYTLADSAQVDVRINMAFDLQLSVCEETETVSAITVSEKETEKRPSVVIAFPVPGETLWSLAKKYGVSMEKIAAQNGLGEGEELKAGMRLLVPRG